MKALKVALLGSAMSLLAAGNAFAGYVSIDEFSGPNMSIELHTGNVELFDNNGAGLATPADSIIGQYRDLKLEIVGTTADPGDTSRSAVFFDGSAGTFKHSQDTGVASTTTLTYDGLAGVGLGANLSGLTGIAIGVLRSDLGLTWVLDLIDSLGNHATKEFDTTCIRPSGPLPPGCVLGPQEVYQDFSTFTVDVGFLWNDVDIIKFVANKNGIDDLDTEVDYIRAVPEPATLAVLGIGLLGLGIARRRKSA